MAILNCDYFSIARRGVVSFTAILPLEKPPDPPLAEELTDDSAEENDSENPLPKSDPDMTKI